MAENNSVKYLKIPGLCILCIISSGWNYWKSDKYLQWDCSQNGTAHNFLITWLTWTVKSLVIKCLFGFFLFTVAELSRSTISLSSHSLKKKKKKNMGLIFSEFIYTFQCGSEKSWFAITFDECEPVAADRWFGHSTFKRPLNTIHVQVWNESKRSNKLSHGHQGEKLTFIFPSLPREENRQLQIQSSLAQLRFVLLLWLAETRGFVLEMCFHRAFISSW